MDDEEDDGKLEVLSLKKGGKQLPGYEIEATTQSHEIIDSDSSQYEEYDSSQSWDINFDFIQAVICLKSTTSKLQRVPADDVVKIFKNQWVLSRDVKSVGEQKSVMKLDSSIFRTSPIHRKRLKNLNYETKHLEHDDPIRPTNNFNLNTEKVVIPETDESETSSVESSPIMAKQTYPVLDFIEFQSTVDSGFYSEKPESAEINTETVNFIPLEKSGYLNEINRKAVFEIRNRGRTTTKRKYSDPKQPSPSPSISSASLNYVLRSSECNELLVRSVKAILNGLKGIEHSASSLRVNWHGSVQQEGIEAVVNVVDQLEKEKGSNSCRDKAAATVRKVLQNMLYSNENNMVR